MTRLRHNPRMARCLLCLHLVKHSVNQPVMPNEPADDGATVMVVISPLTSSSGLQSLARRNGWCVELGSTRAQLHGRMVRRKPRIVVVGLDEDATDSLETLRMLSGSAIGAVLFAAASGGPGGALEAAARTCGAAVVIPVSGGTDTLEQEIHAALRRSPRGMEVPSAIRRGAVRGRLMSADRLVASAGPWTTSFSPAALAYAEAPRGLRRDSSDARHAAIADTRLGGDGNLPQT